MSEINFNKQDRHKLYLDSPTQIGINKIELPQELAKYYKSNATTYVQGTQVGSEAEYFSKRIRYIRDYLNGSTINVGNHWVEIKQYSNGVNVALNCPVSGSVPQINTYPYSKITDGSTSTSYYGEASVYGLQYVQIDLEDYYDLDYVQVWHYYYDGRTYYQTKTQISDDGANWKTIFDSADSGTYLETSSGKTHTIHESYCSISFDSPILTREIEVGNGNMNLGDIGSNFLNFDGENDYIEKYFSSSEITVTFYSKRPYLEVYSHDGSGSTQSSFKDVSFSIANEIQIASSNNNDSGGENGNSGPLIDVPFDNYFHHFSMAISSNSMDVYKDGVLMGTSTLVSDCIGSTTRKLRIGRTWREAATWYSPSYNQTEITNLKIYNSKLTSTEVNQDMNNFNGIAHPSNILAHYNFNEGSGTILEDSEGTYDITINGGAIWTKEILDLKEQTVTYWEPSSDSGVYWILNSGPTDRIYVKVEGIQKEGTLYYKNPDTDEWEITTDFIKVI